MEKETGIVLRNTQLRNILKKKKFVYIWAKYSLEDKQDTALCARIADNKKKGKSQ